MSSNGIVTAESNQSRLIHAPTGRNLLVVHLPNRLSVPLIAKVEAA